MAKLIEFHLHGPVPKKVKPIPIEQRGKLVEFPKEKFGGQSGSLKLRTLRNAVK
jgi:hypothetical protein